MSKYGISTRLIGALYFDRSLCRSVCTLLLYHLVNAFIEYFTRYLYRGFDVDKCNVSNLFVSVIGHYPNVDNFKIKNYMYSTHSNRTHETAGV